MPVAATTLALAAVVFALKPSASSRVKTRVDAHGLNDRPLYDVTHAVLPDLSGWYWVGDVMVVGLSALGGAWLLAADPALFWSVAWIYAAASVVKVGMTMLTILPDPSGMCEHKARGMRGHLLGHCNELMPSGHMCIPLAALVVLRGRVPPAAWWALLAYTVAVWLLTLAARNHYAIDTVVSLFLVLALAPAVKSD